MKKFSLIIVIVLYSVSCSSNFVDKKASAKKEKTEEVQNDIKNLLVKNSFPILRLAMDDEREL